MPLLRGQEQGDVGEQKQRLSDLVDDIGRLSYEILNHAHNCEYATLGEPGDEGKLGAPLDDSVIARLRRVRQNLTDTVVSLEHLSSHLDPKLKKADTIPSGSVRY